VLSDTAVARPQSFLRLINPMLVALLALSMLSTPPAQAAATNDPGSAQQWHLDDVQVPLAWERSRGEGVVVAVLDTGITPGPDLQCRRFAAEYDATTRTDFAAQNGADVINLVISAPCDTTYENGCRFLDIDAAIATATSLGVTILAAAGNDGSGVVAYPANHPNVIAVGSTDASMQLPPYATFGSALDHVAPGGIDTDTDGDGSPRWCSVPAPPWARATCEPCSTTRPATCSPAAGTIGPAPASCAPPTRWRQRSPASAVVSASSTSSPTTSSSGTSQRSRSRA